MKTNTTIADSKPGKPLFSVRTMGCKVNQYESAAMIEILVKAGFEPVRKGRTPDLTLINTCTVTHKADVEARALIRRAHRANPLGRTIVTGCLAQLRPDELIDLPGVALILGHDRKEYLADYLDDPKQDDGPRIVTPPPGGEGLVPDLGFPEFGRTRAFFRIQDGCNGRCAYCTVPLARGPSRSLDMDNVLKGLDYYQGRGYREVVLTGIHLGAWGPDLSPSANLGELLTRIEGIPGLRLRLSSIEPNEITPEIAGLLCSGRRICPHLHLPLQSGSNRILAAMGRPYTTGFFRDLVNGLARELPGLCLGTDVLVGFPGEDEAAFIETADFLAELPLSYLHVFSFSARPGTVAADMPGKIHPGEIKKRVALLRGLGQEKRQRFIQNCLGQVRDALIENTRDKATGLTRGLTDNYITVIIPDSTPTPGQIVKVRLLEQLDETRALGRWEGKN